MKKHHLHIVLPWPNKALAPNVRCHWAIKYRASKAAHRTAHLETFHKMEGCRASPVGKIDVRLSFYPPDKRRRDPDNYSGKMILDGLVRAGIISDDSFWCINLQLQAVYDKGGYTEIFIEEVL